MMTSDILFFINVQSQTSAFYVSSQCFLTLCVSPSPPLSHPPHSPPQRKEPSVILRRDTSLPRAAHLEPKSTSVLDGEGALPPHPKTGQGGGGGMRAPNDLVHWNQALCCSSSSPRTSVLLLCPGWGEGGCAMAGSEGRLKGSRQACSGAICLTVGVFGGAGGRWWCCLL